MEINHRNLSRSLKDVMHTIVKRETDTKTTTHLLTIDKPLSKEQEKVISNSVSGKTFFISNDESSDYVELGGVLPLEIFVYGSDMELLSYVKGDRDESSVALVLTNKKSIKGDDILLIDESITAFGREVGEMVECSEVLNSDTLLINTTPKPNRLSVELSYYKEGVKVNKLVKLLGTIVNEVVLQNNINYLQHANSYLFDTVELPNTDSVDIVRKAILKYIDKAGNDLDPRIGFVHFNGNRTSGRIPDMRSYRVNIFGSSKVIIIHSGTLGTQTISRLNDLNTTLKMRPEFVLSPMTYVGKLVLEDGSLDTTNQKEMVEINRGVSVLLAGETYNHFGYNSFFNRVQQNPYYQNQGGYTQRPFGYGSYFDSQMERGFQQQQYPRNDNLARMMEDLQRQQRDPRNFNPNFEHTSRNGKDQFHNDNRSESNNPTQKDILKSIDHKLGLILEHLTKEKEPSLTSEIKSYFESVVKEFKK